MNVTFEMIDLSIRSVDWNSFKAAPQSLVPQTMSDRVRSVAKMYRGLRPLFVFASTFPAIPQTWRTGLQLFTASMDALSEESGATPDFKAGKDL